MSAQTSTIRQGCDGNVTNAIPTTALTEARNVQPGPTLCTWGVAGVVGRIQTGGRVYPSAESASAACLR